MVFTVTLSALYILTVWYFVVINVLITSPGKFTIKLWLSPMPFQHRQFITLLVKQLSETATIKIWVILNCISVPYKN